MNLSERIAELQKAEREIVDEMARLASQRERIQREIAELLALQQGAEPPPSE